MQIRHDEILMAQAMTLQDFKHLIGLKMSYLQVIQKGVHAKESLMPFHIF